MSSIPANSISPVIGNEALPGAVDAPQHPGSIPISGIAKAVRTLNAVNYAGEGREVAFSVDHATRQAVITVIDSSTKEIITQWPPKYLLELAADQNAQTRDS